MTLQEARKVIGLNIHHLNGTMLMAVATIMDAVEEKAESEDEKIREGFLKIIKQIRRSGGLTLNKIPLDRCKAWLEKKKEQKKDNPLEDFSRGYNVGYYNGVIDREKQKEYVHIPETCKEKSDSLTDMDERIRKELEAFFADDLRGYVWHDIDVADILAWLEKKKEQKLTDEERMKNDKQFISICQHLETLISESKNDEAKESIDKDYRWFCEFYRKSRSVPVEENYKKPAEWSEEDERILKGIIGLVDHDQHYGVSNKEMIDWLKSLRPSWKPSEEQIRALERAIVRFNSVDDIPILTELRDKLKKL